MSGRMRSMQAATSAFHVMHAERELRKSSQIDGSKRIQLSSSILTMQIPPHDVEPGAKL